MNSERVENKTWRQSTFWKIVSGTFLVLFLLVGGLNFIVDPFAIYGTSLFPAITFNKYQNKLFLLRHFQPPPGALIIGSSRVQSIDPDDVRELTGLDTFNWEVPAAKAETIYSCLRIALEDFDIPVKMVIVGIEPEVFHPTRELSPQVLQVAAYTKYFPEQSTNAAWQDKFQRLFTINQTIRSITVLKRMLTGTEDEESWITWRPDGIPVYDWSKKPHHVSAIFSERLGRGIRIYPDNNFIVRQFTHLDEGRKEYWEKFLDICVENDIEIYCFFAPLHPDLYDVMIRRGTEPIFDQTVEYVEETVTASGGVWRDYRRIEEFGGESGLFRDGWHMLPENGRRLLDDLMSGYDPGTTSEDR